MRRIIYKHPSKWAFLWALFIFCLCATPGRYIPTASWLELLSFDKLVHAGVFFVQTALLIVALRQKLQRSSAALLALIISAVYGAALELMQATVFSERSADVLDIAANSTGCLLALLFSRRY